MTAALNNFDPLDRTVLVVGVAAGDQTVTASDLADCDAVYLTGGATAGRSVTFATKVWQGPVCANGGNAQSVTARQGTIAIAIPPGDRIDAEIDGTADGLAGTPVADGSILLTALDLSNVKTRIRSISLGDGDQAPAASVLAKYGILRLTGATGAGGAGDTVTLLPAAWRGYIGAELTNVATVTVAVGTGQITLAPGQILAVQLDGSANGIIGQAISQTDTPSWLSATVQAYLDAQAFRIKDPALVAATGNVASLSGEQTLDGVLTSASRVLLPHQTNTAENGLWRTASGAWTREPDMDSWDEALSAYIPVAQGGVNGGRAFLAEPDAVGTIDVSSIPFRIFTERPPISTATPQPLGTAAAGSSGTYADAAHTHAMPTAAQVGALALAGGTMTGNITLAGDPASALQPATKQYVDTLFQGRKSKQSVLAISNVSNHALSGETTIDGQATNNSRVMLNAQTAAAENGIWVTAAGAWTRATDADTWDEIAASLVYVEKGATYGDTLWGGLGDTGAGTLGTTAIAFTQLAGIGTYQAGSRMTLTGRVFSIADGAVDAAALAALAVTVAKMSVSATSRILGRKTAGAGAAEELTGSDVSALLPDFSTEGALAAAGRVPSPGAVDQHERVLSARGWIKRPRKYQSGRYYANAGVQSGMSISPNADTIYLSWLNLDGPINIAKVAQRVGTAGTAGSKFRVAIYAPDPANGDDPGLLLSQCSAEQDGGQATTGGPFGNGTFDIAMDTPGPAACDAPGCWVAFLYQATTQIIRLFRDPSGNVNSRNRGFVSAYEAMLTSTAIINGLTIAQPYASGFPADLTGQAFTSNPTGASVLWHSPIVGAA